MKNVTGYDLVKLMAGSWGTLGVITEVSFKVLPIAETQSTLKINSCKASILTKAINTPYDISGTFYDVGEGMAYIRIEGFDKSVKYRVEQLLREFADFEVELKKKDKFWISAKLGALYICYFIDKYGGKTADAIVTHFVNYAGSRSTDASVYVKAGK